MTLENARRGMNLSSFTDEQTASTRWACAQQRATNLAILGAKSVMELCVGPSLQVLERAYAQVGLSVSGNDIDPRWQSYYPQGRWVIGDACNINTSAYDAVVVAPPLSKGCSGKREDALSLEQVSPSYYQFLGLPNKILVYVLPGRTLSVKSDRRQLHKFLSHLSGRVEVVPLVDGVIKYVDVYQVSEG